MNTNINFSSTEWQVIIAAYAYEVLDDPIMSDSTYDFLCTFIVDTATIKDFNPSTGMWIKDLIKDNSELVLLLDNAVYNSKRLGEGARAELLIPMQFITDSSLSYLEDNQLNSWIEKHKLKL